MLYNVFFQNKNVIYPFHDKYSSKMSVLNKLSDLRFMRGVIFGLDRIDVMAKLLNVPHKSTKIIHVAGTNGKGSVVTKLSYYLRHFGYKM